MKNLSFFLLTVSLTTSAIAETMNKEEFIDTVAKLQACIDAKYVEPNVKQILRSRTIYYFQKNLKKSANDNGDELSTITNIRAKKAITAMGWGCETAFNKLLALPIPPE